MSVRVILSAGSERIVSRTFAKPSESFRSTHAGLDIRCGVLGVGCGLNVSSSDSFCWKRKNSIENVCQAK